MSVSLMKVLLTMSQNHLKWVRMKWQKAGLGFSQSWRRIQSSAGGERPGKSLTPLTKAVNSPGPHTLSLLVRARAAGAACCPGTRRCQRSSGQEGLTGGAVGPEVSRPRAVALVSSQADPHAHPLVLAGEIATGIHCGERDMSPSIHAVTFLVKVSLVQNTRDCQRNRLHPAATHRRVLQAPAPARAAAVGATASCIGGCCAPGAPAWDKTARTQHRC